MSKKLTLKNMIISCVCIIVASIFYGTITGHWDTAFSSFWFGTGCVVWFYFIWGENITP